MGEEVFKGDITTWKIFCKRNLEIKDIVEPLFDCKVLTKNQRDKVKFAISDHRKDYAWEKLLDYVKRRKKAGTTSFIKVLRGMGNDHCKWVADQMTETQTPTQLTIGRLVSQIFSFSVFGSTTSVETNQTSSNFDQQKRNSHTPNTSDFSETEDDECGVNDDVKDICTTLGHLSKEMMKMLEINTRKSQPQIKKELEQLLKGLEHNLNLLIEGHKRSIQSTAFSKLQQCKGKFNIKTILKLDANKRKKAIESIEAGIMEIITMQNKGTFCKVRNARLNSSRYNEPTTSYFRQPSSGVPRKITKFDPERIEKIKAQLGPEDFDYMDNFFRHMTIDEANNDVPTSPPRSRKTPARNNFY